MSPECPALPLLGRFFNQLLMKVVGESLLIGDGGDIPAYVEPVVTAGHEFSGRVVALGEGAAEVYS